MRPLRDPHDRPAGRGRRARPRAAAHGRSRAGRGVRGEVPVRALRRPAAARRHRARAGGRARPARRRRADLDARRLDPHRRAQPAAQLKRERGLAILYITHDLASARYLADHILVLYRGRIVEEGPRPTRCSPSPSTRTRALLASMPDPTRRPFEPDRGAARPRVRRGRPRRRLPLRLPLPARDRRLRPGSRRSSPRRGRASRRVPLPPLPRPGAADAHGDRRRPAAFPPDFLWGAATAVVPDRGRRRTRTAAARASGTASAATPGKDRERRHRRGRVRPLPPLAARTSR